MARLYTKRLLSGSVTATEYSAVVPENVLWVVRDAVYVWNGDSDGSLEAYTLSITPAVLIIDYLSPVVDHAGVQGHWQGRQVVEAGETLLFATTTATWYVLVTGYELELP